MVEQEETFMSSPALSVWSDLNGLMTLKAMRVGCTSGSIPRAALSEGYACPQSVVRWWAGSYLDKICHYSFMETNSLEGQMVDDLDKDRICGLAVEKSQSVEFSSCLQPAKPDGGNGSEPLINQPNKTKSKPHIWKEPHWRTFLVL